MKIQFLHIGVRRSNPIQDRARHHSPPLAEHAVRAEFFRDAKQLVVLRGAIGAARGARLDLAAVRGNGDVGDRRVLGLA